MPNKSLPAFTLLEILLVVAIISIVSGIGLSIYQSYQNKNSLIIAANTIKQTLRRAQVASQANDGNTTWGVKIQTGNIILFKGTSYALRDTTYDETFEMPTTLAIGGIQEITFTIMYGLPSTFGTISLTTLNNDSIIIDINAKGRIQ